MATATDPKEKEIRKLAFEYLIAVYGPDKLNDFSQGRADRAGSSSPLDPTEPANYQALGKLYEDQGRYEEAEATFKKAIDVKPKEPMGYQMLAGFYNRQGEFDKTMEAFQQRADMEPNNPEAWHTIGGYYQDKVFRDKRLLAQAGSWNTRSRASRPRTRRSRINPEYFEAMTYKNILLRQQALYEKDPGGPEAADQRGRDVLQQGHGSAEEAEPGRRRGGGRRQEGREVRPSPRAPRRGWRKLAAPFSLSAASQEGPSRGPWAQVWTATPAPTTSPVASAPSQSRSR